MQSAPVPESKADTLDTFLRLGWIALAPGVAMILIAIVAMNGGWFDGRSLALAVCIVAAVLLRWWDFSRGNSRTSEGEPATRGHLIRYTIGLPLIAAAAWAVANAFATLTGAGA